GRCNHAGAGAWRGIASGNTNFIGIEAENTGGPDDLPWPAVQFDAYWRGAAAVLARAGRSAGFCVGHKEYALPQGRKDDPTLDMDDFRRRVALALAGAAPLPSLIPPTEATGTARATLRRGMSGDLVKSVQRACGVADDGFFGPFTEAAVRAFQSA